MADKTLTLSTLRAEVAMRAEDTRIARKHRDEAAARTSTPANVAAFDGAERWLETCRENERVARSTLIRANLDTISEGRRSA